MNTNNGINNAQEYDNDVTSYDEYVPSVTLKVMPPYLTIKKDHTR